MINRITLLLFIGLAWGQVEQDKLVLKDETKYLGEFSTIDGKNVLFKPEGAFGFQPISINKIKTLELSDGWLLIRNGRKLISRNEYQALSIEEKAQYDARILKPMTKWLRAGFFECAIRDGCWWNGKFPGAFIFYCASGWFDYNIFYVW